MKRFLLRYGVFAILLVMLAGILYFTDRLELRTKQTVSLFLPDDGCVGYVPLADAASIHAGDTLVVSQTPCGNLTFVVARVQAERTLARLSLNHLGGTDALRQLLQGDTYAAGYIVTGRQKLRTMVTRRIR